MGKDGLTETQMKEAFESLVGRKNWDKYAKMFGEDIYSIFAEDDYRSKICFGIGLEYLINKRLYEAYSRLNSLHEACVTERDKSILDKLIKLCYNEEEMKGVQVGDWIRNDGFHYFQVLKKDEKGAVLKAGFIKDLQFRADLNTESDFYIEFSDLKLYQTVTQEEKKAIEDFFAQHPEEWQNFTRNTEQYFALREKLLQSNMMEARNKPFHFYQKTTEKTAFIVNLKDFGEYIRVAYGFASIMEERFLEDWGEDDDSINLRDCVKIRSEADEALAAERINSFYRQYRDTQKDDILEIRKERRKKLLKMIHNRLKPLGFKKKSSAWNIKIEKDLELTLLVDKSRWSDIFSFLIYISPEKNVGFGCYTEALKYNGKDRLNWQLYTEEELINWFEEMITTRLLPLMQTPLAELGKKAEIWNGCHCKREKCQDCWVQKNLWEANGLK